MEDKVNSLVVDQRGGYVELATSRNDAAGGDQVLHRLAHAAGIWALVQVFLFAHGSGLITAASTVRCELQEQELLKSTEVAGYSNYA
jgi:hypothetical protein